MLLGVAGAITANFIGTQMGFYRTGEPAGFFASVIGAVGLAAGVIALIMGWRSALDVTKRVVRESFPILCIAIVLDGQVVAEGLLRAVSAGLSLQGRG
jgi:Ca2+/Na+ antiporter